MSNNVTPATTNQISYITDLLDRRGGIYPLDMTMVEMQARSKSLQHAETCQVVTCRCPYGPLVEWDATDPRGSTAAYAEAYKAHEIALHERVTDMAGRLDALTRDEASEFISYLKGGRR